MTTPYFSNIVNALLTGRTIAHAFLVLFNFKDGPVRVWLGTGQLAAGGFTWSGLGELASISDIALPIGDRAATQTYSLSGVDPKILSEGLASAANVKGQIDQISLQFFDAQTMQTLDAPYVVRVGIMDTMKVSAAGPTQRTVTLTSEGLFTRRGMPLFGWLSTEDQNRRFPGAGDRGLEQMPQLVFKKDQWPTF